MAFSLGSSSSEEFSETADINVTPFIDVILVLLIIFMVAAPLSTVDVPVDLPAADAQPTPRPDKPLYVTLKADLSLAVGEDEVAWRALGQALNDKTGLKTDTRIFLRADKAVPYGEVIKLFSEMRANGYLKVSLVANEQGGSTPATPGQAQP
jgi:biopolymer transport protein ExbD